MQLEPARVAHLNRLLAVIGELEREDREQRRYGAAARSPEACLCTPVDYAGVDLSHVPQRILDVDYGCGDPTRYAREGETVLDLGSGSGKHCFMIARKVGADGSVVGVDKTPQMLALARGAVGEVTSALGYRQPNVEFRRGHIENLRWDLDRLAELVRGRSPASYQELDEIESELAKQPLVASNSIDLVVSNCVLNLVDDSSKAQLFQELHRVLKRGGRAVISDIVASEDVPTEMKHDEFLWTGCMAGALRRDRFLDAFVAAGFYGIEELSSYLWRHEQGIIFNSVTVAAYKGKEGPCWETYRSALYRGPFASVHDDDGHEYPRGTAVPVCEKTARLLSTPPYAGHFVVSEALASEEERIAFDCNPAGASARRIPDALRKQWERSGGLNSASSSCTPGGGCC
ncbi:MAG: methyltransferase domain-containing protein [Planctomycetes bacterium]|nr:methyltransferase domain-containing protein [Planctomycetota bacterium]